MSGLGLVAPNTWSDTPGRAFTVTVAVVGIAVGSAPLIGFPSTVPAASAAALAVALPLFRRPRLALQGAVLAMLLPPGLLPTSVQFAASAAAVLFATLAVTADMVRSRRPVRTGPTVLLLALFLFWGVVTLLWTPQPSTAFDLLRRYAVLLLLLLLIVNADTTLRDAGALLNTLALAGWLLIAVSVWSGLTTGYRFGSRLEVLNVNDNQVGNILLLMSAGVLWRAVRPDVQHPRRALFGVYAYLVLSWVVIAQTGSRGSFFGFVALLAALALFRQLRQIAAVAAILALTAAIFVPAVVATTWERLTTPNSELSRSTLWSAGLALAADHPWGAGLANGPVVMRQYVNARVSTDYFKIRGSYPAHNPLIEVADDTGLPGLTLYTAALLVAAGSFLATAQRARFRSDPHTDCLVAVVGAVSIPFLLVWAKSGGAEYHITAIVLVALWLLPGLLQREGSATSEPGMSACRLQ